MKRIDKLNIAPTEIARYFLFRAMEEDGDTITPLRMQKLVYYAYSFVLAKNKTRLFDEPIQAWVNGPVVYSLYDSLKKYGRSPISEEFLGDMTPDEFESWKVKTFPVEILETIEEVYDKYMRYTPFELVLLTHSEKPWSNARAGLSVTDSARIQIEDKDIVEQYQSA